MMPNCWVLMTAMPPTRGHTALIDYAHLLAGGGFVKIVLNTQPDEPYVEERYRAIQEYVHQNYPYTMSVFGYRKPIQQVPESEEDDAFWEMWSNMLYGYGFKPGDTIVASEQYGIRLAQACHGKFMPYDPDRSVIQARGTDVRFDPQGEFAQMIPEFQKYIRKTVTIFGAESTGKTTLSSSTASIHNGHWLPEYARPYLEMLGNELNDSVMTDIWQGQLALQNLGQKLTDKPFIIQDTDLFSTVGYWRNWSPDTMPSQLVVDAMATKSDLYVVTQSNIPFEPDPLRYGGDVRELPDKYWIDLLEEYDLPYVVLGSTGRYDRYRELAPILNNLFGDPLKYSRIT